jgi:hypothetical protein
MVALIDQGQEEAHRRCKAACENLTGPLVTTWPCLTEAMYFLYQLRRWEGQKALWNYIERGALLVHASSEPEVERMHWLMEKYQDTPMDLADASLVAVAEARGLKRILTLDSDFYIYRINGKDPFEVIPSP